MTRSENLPEDRIRPGSGPNLRPQRKRQPSAPGRGLRRAGCRPLLRRRPVDRTPCVNIATATNRDHHGRRSPSVRPTQARRDTAARLDQIADVLGTKIVKTRSVLDADNRLIV
jgi:hypothetical protein